MQPTHIGVIAAIVGILVMSRHMTAALLAVVVATIFGAASAINATALGGASIQPSVFLLMFLLLRIARSPDLLSDKMEGALKACAIFGVFVAYGLVSAYLYPRLFAYQIELPPTKILGSNPIFGVVPLAPSTQNITQSTYLVGSFLMMLATAFVARTERRSKLVAMTVIYLCWAHIVFGILDVVSSAAGLTFLDLVRNANYSIVDQQIGGFHRIQGTFSETSSYSAYGFVLLIFVTELWLRQIRQRLTGWTALALGLILFFTTSTSAYVGITVYSIVLAFRIVYFPSTRGQRKAVVMIGLAMLAFAVVLLMLIALPQFVETFGGILEEMTTKKGRSESGIQRSFWVQKGWEAFIHTKGLGVGVGSFRSSSLLSAIAGSMGVVGMASFMLFIYRILPGHRLTIYRLEGTNTEAVGSAAAWAAVVGLAPQVVSGASPDPGLLFAFMSGLAIAWAPHLNPAPSEGKQPPAWAWMPRRAQRARP